MKSLLYLLGTTLEFSDGLSGKGFYFNNPNAARTCACGKSFAVCLKNILEKNKTPKHFMTKQELIYLVFGIVIVVSLISST